MGQIYQICCANCGFRLSLRNGSTCSLVDEAFTVACAACCSIEMRKYTYPDRPVKPTRATGWWGRRKRQKELDDLYSEESAQWSAGLEKRREEALRQPCSKCGDRVHRVNFGDPFIEPISIDIGCPECKCKNCIRVTLEAMID